MCSRLRMSRNNTSRVHIQRTQNITGQYIVIDMTIIWQDSNEHKCDRGIRRVDTGEHLNPSSSADKKQMFRQIT